MKYLPNIAGGLLGFIFFVFGIMHFLQDRADPAMPEVPRFDLFMKGFVPTGYLDFVKAWRSDRRPSPGDSCARAISVCSSLDRSLREHLGVQRFRREIRSLHGPDAHRDRRARWHSCSGRNARLSPGFCGNAISPKSREFNPPESQAPLRQLVDGLVGKPRRGFLRSIQVKSKALSWVWRFALGLTQEPAARLPYLALTRDQPAPNIAPEPSRLPHPSGLRFDPRGITALASKHPPPSKEHT